MNCFEFLYGRFLLAMELASADKDDGEQSTEQDEANDDLDESDASVGLGFERA